MSSQLFVNGQRCSENSVQALESIKEASLRGRLLDSLVLSRYSNRLSAQANLGLQNGDQALSLMHQLPSREVLILVVTIGLYRLLMT